MLHHRVVGTGKPVLLLHGVTLDHRFMMDVMEGGFWASTGWKRIYVDLPGHGKSHDVDVQCQDDVLNLIADFIKDVIPDGLFAVAGLSRGSYLARGLLHLFPNRISGIALIVPGGNPGSDPARLPAPQVLHPDETIRPELSEAEVWAHENMSAVQRWDIIEKRRALVAPARALFDAALDDRVMDAFPFSFDEESIVFDAPSLIVVGRQDSISGYLDGMDLMHRFPRATLAVLDTASHALAWERPQVFHALVRDWLERMSKG